MEFVATCLFGLEKFLGDEIKELGYERIETIDGRVTFRGDINAVCRSNMWLRFAERVFIKVGEFKADSFSALFDGTKALNWEDFIGANDAFPVKGHSIKSNLTSIPDCQSIVKKAIVERLKEKYKKSWFEETGVKYQIEFFILNNKATLMIDTSGTPLHKRGYRTEANEAPLRETLACAVAKIARPREDVLFWDCMCGSGTIAIEAALMMTNRAPGLMRGFAAEEFPFIPKKSWQEARAEAVDLINRNSAFEAYASDISPAAVEIAKANVKRAGMEGHVKTFVRDALTIETMGRRGTIVCNPPYGERLSNQKDVEILYRKMGQHFKTLDRWQIYILCESQDFERLYGKRADKKRKLYNGMIPCTLYQYFKNENK